MQRSSLKKMRWGLSRFYRGILALIFLLWLSAGTTLGQRGKLRFSVDHAQFRLQQDYVYLEVYYSVNRDGLAFKKEADRFVARFNIETSIFQGDSLIIGDGKNIEDWVDSLEEISPTQKLVEISAFQIKEGDYQLRVALTDINSEKTQWYHDNLYLKSYPSDSLILSEVELATSITRVEQTAGKFDKNRLRVIPNPSAVCGTGFPILYFYAEAYNLAYDEKSKKSTYHIRYSIVDTSGKTLIDQLGKKLIKPGASSVVQGGIDIDGLSSGIYIFQMELTDDFNSKKAHTEKRFFVYWVEDFLTLNRRKVAAIVPATSEYDQMNEEEINKGFEQLKYISTEEEQNIFNKLNLEGKRKFMVGFWQRRNPTPNTPVNEYKQQYLGLLNYANDEFSMGMREGWKTDRGRVLLTYGKPDYIDRFPSGMNTNAYQIWHYYQLEGGAKFIFVDRKDIGDFELVHSTLKGEIQNYDWNRELYK